MDDPTPIYVPSPDVRYYIDFPGGKDSKPHLFFGFSDWKTMTESQLEQANSIIAPREASGEVNILALMTDLQNLFPESRIVFAVAKPVGQDFACNMTVCTAGV